MKIGFFFSGVFWGVLLIILGISTIVKTVFNVNIPLFRTAFSLFIIYIGLTMLFNGFSFETEKNTVLFSERKMNATNSFDKYNIIFGKGEVDFTVRPPEYGRREVNIIFGSGIIRISSDIPVKIKVHSAFAAAFMPDGNQIAFGEYTYRTGSLKEEENYLEIEANVVFGSLQIIDR